MNYREQLSRPISKNFLDQLVQNIFDNPEDFQNIFQLVFDADNKVAWRAAWACAKISEKHPDWFTDKQILEIMKFSINISHGGVHRGCLSILSNLRLPNSIPVEFINSCFEWMISPKSPIAVQSLSMKILYSICQIVPELSIEFKAYLENVDFESYSAGFNSTRKNTLKKLKIN
ncbi:MAG: hypothetical protein WCG93_15715 [Paludibacter sp.]